MIGGVRDQPEGQEGGVVPCPAYFLVEPRYGLHRLDLVIIATASLRHGIDGRYHTRGRVSLQCARRRIMVNWRLILGFRDVVRRSPGRVVRVRLVSEPA